MDAYSTKPVRSVQLDGLWMHVVHLERDSLLQDARVIPVDYIVV